MYRSSADIPCLLNVPSQRDVHEADKGTGTSGATRMVRAKAAISNPGYVVYTIYAPTKPCPEKSPSVNDDYIGV